MTERPRQVWFRVGQVAALLALALFALLDVSMRFFALRTYWWGVAELPSASFVAALWFVSHRLSPQKLTIWAGAASGASLLVTAIPALFDQLTGRFSFVETAALLGLLVVTTRRAVGRAGSAVVLAVVVAISTQALRGGLDNGGIGLAVVLALVASMALAAGAYLRSLDERRTRQVAAVRADQRAEFARDLHDFIAHHVTGIVVQAQGAQVIAQHDPQRVVAALKQIEQAGAETMASMRRMVGVLRDMDQSPDAPLAPIAGIAELGPLVEGFASSGPPEARLRIEGRVDDLLVEVTSSAYRVVMEALTNVRRHASGATAVDILVERTDDWLLVRVSDDGHSPRAALPRERRGDGFGLVGLTERIRSIGGRIQAGPGIEGGWVIDAVLPVTGAGDAVHPRS